MQRSRNDEVIGKIFVALGKDMRQCLICDGVFTKQGAAEHSNVACSPRTKEDEGARHTTWEQRERFYPILWTGVEFTLPS